MKLDWRKKVFTRNTKTFFRRTLNVFLASLMIVSLILPVLTVSAAENEEEKTKLQEIKEILSAIPYEEYLRKNSDLFVQENGRLPLGSGSIKLTADNIDNEATTTTIEKLDNYEGMSGTSFKTSDENSVTLKFNVSNAGLYHLSFTCIPVVGKASAAERMIKIDGKVPFKEARYNTINKMYVDNYVENENGESNFILDVKDNEIRPTKSEAPEWRTILTEDSSGFYTEPFYYYLSAGEHTITIEAVKEPLIFNSIDFYVAEKTPTYEEYKAKNAGGEGSAEIKIQAENPTKTSEIVIYPVNDRTSPITEPQDPSRIRLNTLGGDKWQMYGQWINYEIEIPAGGAGYYSIIPRFKQSTYSGVYSSRQIKIDGVIPFEEAKRLRFNFDDIWQIKPLNSGGDPFEFYFTEGKHVIEFAVSLGDMADLLRRVEASLKHMNDMYIKIRMLTGSTPDAYRDYGFERSIPDVLTGLRDESKLLYAISDELEEVIGSKGEHTVILDKIALQMNRMANDMDKIAPGLATYKTNIGSLGTWLLERRNQPLTFDYILIQPASKKIPKAVSNVFQNMSFEFSSFVMSFFSDYTTVGLMQEVSKEEKKNMINVWLALGRDQAQIVRQMIGDSFTSKTNIPINVKLVAAGSLLPSTLAGVGPEVSLSSTGNEAINFAIRSAVLPLNEYKGDESKGVAGFDEVKTWFNPAAFVPLTLRNDEKGTANVYGLPENQTFPMMFYRKDILADLEVEIPKTWQDLYNIVPILQKKNLEIGITPGIGIESIFLFQQNIPLYIGDGIATNLDNNMALDAFKRMCNLYTIYKFPITFDFANRFRTGEMPIGIIDYSTYNQLIVFAPEIRGLWEFVPLPGTPREKVASDAGLDYEETEDGLVIDNDSPAGSTCTIMLRTAQKKGTEENAWAFMQWWVGEEAQSRFGNEMVAILGAAAKQPTANLNALYNMPWPTADLKNLTAQFKHLEATPEVPGGYIVTRYVDFAWKAAYNDGATPIDTMQDYMDEINKELTRKRKEFGMAVIERDATGRAIDNATETTENAK